VCWGSLLSILSLLPLHPTILSAASLPSTAFTLLQCVPSFLTSLTFQLLDTVKLYPHLLNIYLYCSKCHYPRTYFSNANKSSVLDGFPNSHQHHPASSLSSPPEVSFLPRNFLFHCIHIGTHYSRPTHRDLTTFQASIVALNYPASDTELNHLARHPRRFPAIIRAFYEEVEYQPDPFPPFYNMIEVFRRVKWKKDEHSISVVISCWNNCTRPHLHAMIKEHAMDVLLTCMTELAKSIEYNVAFMLLAYVRTTLRRQTHCSPLSFVAVCSWHEVAVVSHRSSLGPDIES
jgi:hypothetical protein